MRIKNKAIGLLLGLIILGASGNFVKNTSVESTSNNSPKTSQQEHIFTVKSLSTNSSSTKQNQTNNSDSNMLAKLQKYTYRAGQRPFSIINNNVPNTIHAHDFTKPHIYFSALDSLNRVGAASAYLTDANLGDAPRESQIFKPTGWHNQPSYINRKRIFPQNRGHLIAYSFTYNLDKNGNYSYGQSGSEDNPLNLFTQSAYSNQEIMQITENMVRNSLNNHKKVIYKVNPVFGKNNLMASGVWVQGQTLDGSMQFNRYIYNIQPGIRFNYQTGQNTPDSSITVPDLY